MCGIIGAIHFKDKAATPVNEFIINQFEDQHSRGTQGFGAVFVSPDGTYEVKRSCEPAKAIIDLYTKAAPIIMFHHRMPTSTKNKLSQTHPIVVDNGSLQYKYLVIHNGICSNSHEMKLEHEKLGFVYTTDVPVEQGSVYSRQNFNDSESIAIEIARFAEKQTEEIKAEGYAAIMALQIDKKKDKVVNILFCRTLTAALKMSLDKGQILISSEGPGTEIDDEKLYTWNLATHKLGKKEIKFYERPKPTPVIAPVNDIGKKWERHGRRHMFDNELDDDGMAYYQGYGGTPRVPEYKQKQGQQQLDFSNVIPYEGAQPDYDQAWEAFYSEIEDICEEVQNEAMDKNLVFGISVKDYEARFKIAIRKFKKEAAWWHSTPEKDRAPMGEYEYEDERDYPPMPIPPDDEELGAEVVGFNPHPAESTKVESNQPKDQGVLI